MNRNLTLLGRKGVEKGKLQREPELKDDNISEYYFRHRYMKKFQQNFYYLSTH